MDQEGNAYVTGGTGHENTFPEIVGPDLSFNGGELDAFVAKVVVTPVEASCGDTTGPGGTRVPCACGDTVTTDTKLKDTDPVVSTGPADVCSGGGLSIVSGITLNCNWLTLRGSGGGTGVVFDKQTSGITVKNCTVMGFSIGMLVANAGGFRLQSNTVVDNFFDGITIEEISGGTVWGNKVGNNGGHGIFCFDDCIGNVFAKNHVFGNSGGGIVFPFDGFLNNITDNTVENNSGIGIVFGDGSDSNEVMNNHIHNNGGDGIVVFESSGNLFVAHNVVSDNGGAGIEIEGGATIVANFGKRNAGSGLEIKSAVGSFVANNEFNKNGGHGICVIPGNTDGGGNIGKLNALLPDVTFNGGC